MEQFAEGESTREEIKNKLRQNFDGKIVRKDLTKKIKEGANVPVYVLEFLLGQYCSSDDETVIEKGVQNVKRILADNFVRPDESQKILSQLRKKGSHTIIDMVTVRLDMKKDCFFAEFSNLGVGNVPIADEYPEKFDRLLCGGIWCIVQLDYEVEGDNNFGIEDIDGNPLRSKQKKQKDISPISIRKLTPIQMPHIDIDELKQGRTAFTKNEWLDILLRSIGMEPDEFTYREKWLLLTRMIPLVENNFNLCELGPRSTGKSHLYKEISPNSILISGGQTTVANLFYNMGRKTVGLVGLWDCVAFDEVAGIKFKDKDGIQIMKDYMASGSFARGKEEKAATASMVFVGNINQSVDVLLKTSSLFAPFPQEMGTDTAFLDRMHCYLPGWEIPKFRPEHFTDDYGFISDYLAEFIRELRKEQYGDALDHYFRLGRNLNQRDTIAVRRMIDGYLKLMYPNGEFTKEELEEIIQIALEMRRRVKEQLKKLGGMEFYDVNFSYIDLEDIRKIFSYVFVDEIQDFVGYDLEVIKKLHEVGCNMTLVGDPRQTTYRTHYEAKYKKYAGGKIVIFVQDNIAGMNIDTTTLSTSYRNNQIICDLANQMYPDMKPCDSAMNEKTGHDGIFWVHENDIDKYVDIYNPVQLRYDKRTKVNPIPKTMNFGLSKGLTFNRVLIYPTKPMLDWLSGKSKDMKDESLSKFYVAVTRARYSVAFVYKTKRLPTNDIGTKWTPDVL